MSHSVSSEQQDGLSWTFVVKLEDKIVQDRLLTKLHEMAPKASLPGFRPGKLPIAVLKQRWGESARSESIQELASEASDSVLKDKNIRAAAQPSIVDLTGLKSGDVSFSLRVDDSPVIDMETVKSLSIERYDPIVEESQIDESLAMLARAEHRTRPLAKSRPSRNDDTLVINFRGTIDGTEFKGGSGTNISIQLGSGRFLPEFEAQLVNTRVGDTPKVTLTFPDTYGERDLAGKTAIFDVDVVDHKEPKSRQVDDDFVKELGMSSMTELREKIQESLEKRYRDLELQVARRRLLDILDNGFSFDTPKRMVESELDMILKQIEEARKNNTLSEDEKSKDEATLHAEFTVIAERRVRLGLLLSEVGRINSIEATEQEISQAIAHESQRFPGQERQVYETYRKNPQLKAHLTAPILENKALSKILDDIPTTRSKLSFDDLTDIYKGLNDAESTSETSSSGNAKKKPRKTSKRQTQGESSTTDTKPRKKSA